ncbi:MAG: cache domain-containing protein [Halioglobus sp.]
MTSSVKFWFAWGVGLALIMVLVVWGLLQWNLSNYTRMVSDRLLLLGELRRGAVQQYFSTAEAELRFWSTNPQMLGVQKSLNGIWDGASASVVAEQVLDSYVQSNPNPVGFFLNLDDAMDGTAYSELHGVMHPRAKLFVTQRGYYDFFLIGPAGDILYTVEKEADFTTNLETGQWRNSGLAEVYQRAKKERREGTIAISDIQAYAPSEGAPAIFMATAMHDTGGEFLGVIAFQLPTDRILGIMNYTSGMGETGETYLVGQDLLMRSDSRFSDASTLLSQEVDTSTVALALEGAEGVQLTLDYRAVEVMSAYLPMQVGDARWAVMAEIDKAEIAQGAARERPAMAGILSFVYALSLWSLWYWRGREQFAGGDLQLADLDFPDADGPGFGA